MLLLTLQPHNLAHPQPFSNDQATPPPPLQNLAFRPTQKEMGKKPKNFKKGQHKNNLQTTLNKQPSNHTKQTTLQPHYRDNPPTTLQRQPSPQGWLAGWLAGCLAGWLAEIDWLAGLLAGWLSVWVAQIKNQLKEKAGDERRAAGGMAGWMAGGRRAAGGPAGV